MRLSLNFIIICNFLLSSSLVKSQVQHKEITFKKVEGTDLKLHIFGPKEEKENQNKAAIVFFFGGGWVGGTPEQFYPHCEHLSKKGMLAISAEYRTEKSHGTTPFQCVEDGKSAVRWIRKNSKKLGVDPNKIVAAGGSAGGHVAACTGIIKGFETGDLNISSRPQALVLFNPVCDTSLNGYGNKKVGKKWRSISPLHHAINSTTPTCIFHGTADTTVPLKNVLELQKAIQGQKIKCELHTYKGAKHGFFNHGRGNGKAYEDTVKKMTLFLVEQGFLKTKQR